MIIIQPIGGLCNRMRAIGSAMILAEKRGEKVQVYWKVAPELGCPFEELFEKPTAFSLVNYHSDYYPPKMFRQLTSRRLGNDEIRSVRTGEGLPDDFIKTLPGRLYIATEEHFYPNRDYSAFVPQKRHLDKVSALTGPASHLIGVHIRRTDNKPAIGKSSTDAFLAAMEAEIAADPDVRFYLATDDLSEEKTLREHFPGRIISNEGRDLSRDSVTGIQDALVDLYSLSRCSKIIGSFYSSFTDLAADIRGIPLIVAGEEKA